MSQIIKLNLKRLNNLIATVDLRLSLEDTSDTDELIEKIKKCTAILDVQKKSLEFSNGIDINTDETQLADEQVSNQIKNIKDECQLMMEQVNSLSQEISSHWSKKQMDKVQFNKDLIIKNLLKNICFKKN